jgi:hypothetical protein
MRLAEGIIICVSLVAMIATSIWVADEKAPQTNYKVYTIPAGTFDLDVQIIVTEDTAFAAKYIAKNFDSSLKSPDLDARAVTFGTADGKPPIIWFSDIEDSSVVQHELLHVTIEMMKSSLVIFYFFKTLYKITKTLYLLINLLGM